MKSLLTAEETADLLGISVNALAVMRSRNQGPTYIKNGRWIRYEQDAIETWLKSRRVHPERTPV